MKKLVMVLFALLLIGTTCIVPAHSTTSYVLQFPSGVSSYTTRDGTTYYPGTTGLVTLTDPSLIKGFLEAGFVTVSGSVPAMVTHDYLAASTGTGLTWTLTAAENIAKYLTLTDLGAAGIAIATATSGKEFVVTNSSGYAVTFKASGQTGVVIANGKTVLLRANGTDFAYAVDDGIIQGANIWSAAVPLVLSHDATDHAATNETADGSSYTVAASALAAGKSLRISASGISVGANAAKSVNLYVGDAIVSTITFPTEMVGNWYCQFILHELTDLAHQRISAFGVAGTSAGATPGYAVDYAVATKDFSAAKTVKIQLISANASDTITQKLGIVELLP